MAGLNLLTDKTILKEIRDGKAILLGDGGNLHLRLRGNGQSWLFRFKIPLKAEWADPADKGKPVEIGLGSYPALTLAAAREKVTPYRQALANGVDPRTIGKISEDGQKTFETYAEAYIGEAEAEWKNAKHKQQWRNTLKVYVYPKLGKKLPASIKRGDIEAALRPLWDAQKYETFSRVRMRIETVLNYAFHKLDIDRANPARWQGNLKLDFGKVSPKRLAKKAGKLKSHAAPPWRDVPTIMASLRAKPEVVSALALRFSILTAARSGEMRGATWDEMDTEGAAWHIPGDRTKNEEAHSVPLNEEALAILETMKGKKHPDSDRVFPGGNGGVISDVAINKVLHAAMPGITAHGTARSSFRDWTADATSFPDKVAEAALNHKNPNETEASYLRTKFFDRRVELMKAWGEFLKGKDNVVELNPAKQTG